MVNTAVGTTRRKYPPRLVPVLQDNTNAILASQKNTRRRVSVNDADTFDLKEIGEVKFLVVLNGDDPDL
jgi:hypothetical protein